MELSSFVNRAIPNYIIEDNPQFALFIQKYFESLEEHLAPYDIITNMLTYSDIDSTIDHYYESYRKTYAAEIPEAFKIDLKLLIKTVRELYRAKSTEEAYEFAFHAIWDIPIDFYYPKIDILRTSDGKWKKAYKIFFNDSVNTYQETLLLFDKKIVGLATGARGYVDTWINDSEDGFPPYGINVIDRLGNFQNDYLAASVENTGNGSLIITKTDRIAITINLYRATYNGAGWDITTQPDDVTVTYTGTGTNGDPFLFDGLSVEVVVGGIAFVTDDYFEFKGAEVIIESDIYDAEDFDKNDMPSGTIVYYIQDGIAQEGIDATSAGYYDNTDGHLSSDKLLQDSYKYQEFSYVIKSAMTLDQYQNTIKRLLHPAGMLMFGEKIPLPAELGDVFDGKIYSYARSVIEWITITLVGVGETASNSNDIESVNQQRQWYTYAEFDDNKETIFGHFKVGGIDDVPSSWFEDKADEKFSFQSAIEIVQT